MTSTPKRIEELQEHYRARYQGIDETDCDRLVDAALVHENRIAGLSAMQEDIDNTRPTIYPACRVLVQQDLETFIASSDDGGNWVFRRWDNHKVKAVPHGLLVDLAGVLSPVEALRVFNHWFTEADRPDPVCCLCGAYGHLTDGNDFEVRGYSGPTIMQMAAFGAQVAAAMELAREWNAELWDHINQLARRYNITAASPCFKHAWAIHDDVAALASRATPSALIAADDQVSAEMVCLTTHSIQDYQEVGDPGAPDSADPEDFPHYSEAVEDDEFNTLVPSGHVAVLVADMIFRL